MKRIGWRGSEVHELRDRTKLLDWMDFQNRMSGRTLAAKADLSQGTVNALVSGRRRTCNRRTAWAIERALGVPTGFFFDELVSTVGRSTTRDAA